MDNRRTYRWPAGLTAISSRPCIVGTVSTPAGLDDVRTNTPTTCDVIELRHDLIQRPAADLFETATHLRSHAKGIIFTIRLASEGGKWEDDSQERFDTLVDALNFVNMVDIESASKFAQEFIGEAVKTGGLAILSSHDFETTPALPVLKERCRLADARPHLIHKVATRLHTEDDLEILKSLIAGAGSQMVCAMGMGDLGPRSRIELAHAGSCLTYGYLDQAAAPGQLSCSDLFSALSDTDSPSDGRRPTP